MPYLHVHLADKEKNYFNPSSINSVSGVKMLNECLNHNFQGSSEFHLICAVIVFQFKEHNRVSQHRKFDRNPDLFCRTTSNRSIVRSISIYPCL